MRIVLLDTDKTIQETLSEKCHHSGGKLEVYSTVEKAYAAIAREPEAIDVVLLCREIGNNDVMGLELSKQLRGNQQLADIPIIILSSKLTNVEFAKHQNGSDGANAYLRKPVTALQLVSTIESVTGLKFPVKAAMPGLNITLLESSKVIDLTERTASGVVVETTLKIFPDELPVHFTPISLPVLEPRTGMIEVGLYQTEPKSEAQPQPVAHKTQELPQSQQSDSALEIDLSASSNPGLELQSSSGNEMEVASVTSSSATSAGASAGSSNSVIELSISQMQIEPAAGDPSVEEFDLESPASFDAQASSPSAVSGANEKELDAAAARDLPYLFGGGLGNATVQGVAHDRSRSVSMGGAGGPDLSAMTSDSSDVETLKKYLMMREQDAAILSAQLSYAKEELSKSDQSIKRLTMEVETVNHQIDDKSKRIETLEQQLMHAGKSQEGEIEQLRFELKSKIDRTKFLEDQLANSAAQYEKLRDRVRLDIRKIRVREKELENKLEILKKDSETLIAARESKILELKRKIDLLEFNYDTLQDQNESEKANVSQAHEKIAKVVKVLKLAMGIIEGETDSTQPLNENDLKVA